MGLGLGQLPSAKAERRNLLRQKINKQLALEIAKLTANSFRKGGKLLLCGNGGSAADAAHCAGELINGFGGMDLCYPAIDLTAFVPTITAIANDKGYEFIFSRQVKAFGKSGDVLWGFSTSGRSANVKNALELAKNFGSKNLYTTGFFGKKPKGWPYDRTEASTVNHACQWCDISVFVEADDTGTIQGVHSEYYHLICELIWKETNK